jgi:hypothetical protein
MEKILIYSNDREILIISNANITDLLCEYYGLLTDTPYPKKDFSYNIYDAENVISAMTINRKRYHFCKRYSTHKIAKKQFKKLSTYDFGAALNCISELSKTATK